MKKIKAYFADFDASVLTTRRAVFFEILAAFLGGVIFGILIAPPKKLKVGCENGSTIIKGGKVKKGKKDKKDKKDKKGKCCGDCEKEEEKEEK